MRTRKQKSGQWTVIDFLSNYWFINWQTHMQNTRDSRAEIPNPPCSHRLQLDRLTAFRNNMLYIAHPYSPHQTVQIFLPAILFYFSVSVRIERAEIRKEEKLVEGLWGMK